MVRKISLIAISLLLATTHLMAQNELSPSELTLSQTTSEKMTAVQQINAIKRQPEKYLFAEATSSTIADAAENADILLNAEIENWAIEQGKNISGFAAQIKDNTEMIDTKRGIMFRVFKYVNKNDIFTFEGDQQGVLIPTQQSPLPQNNTDTQPSKQSQNNINTRLAQQPQEKNAEPQNDIPEALYNSAIVSDMLRCTEGKQIEQFVKAKQQEGVITQYDSYTRNPKEIDCYIFVYNRQSEIVAYLLKFNGRYFNLKTRTYDNLTNYSGGAIWFRTVFQ